MTCRYCFYSYIEKMFDFWHWLKNGPLISSCSQKKATEFLCTICRTVTKWIERYVSWYINLDVPWWCLCTVPKLEPPGFESVTSCVQVWNAVQWPNYFSKNRSLYSVSRSHAKGHWSEPGRSQITKNAFELNKRRVSKLQKALRTLILFGTTIFSLKRVDTLLFME